MRLEIHPELGCGAEEETEAKRGVRADTAAIVDDLRDAVRGDVKRSRQVHLGQAVADQEFLGKDFSWRAWGEFVVPFRFLYHS